MAMKAVVLMAIFVTNFRLCQSLKYENYTLFKVTPTTDTQLDFLRSLTKERFVDILFWQPPYKLNTNVQFIVSAPDTVIVQDKFKTLELPMDKIVDNVQKSFDIQVGEKYLRMHPEKFSFDHFHSLPDIEQWLIDVVSKHHDIANLESIGVSNEGRNIYLLTIKRTPHPIARAVVEGGVHSNEFISPAFVLYLANQLLTVNDTDDLIMFDVATNNHFYLLPMINPDGYHYAYTHNRMWRKNRRPFPGGIGVDLNRNFDNAWSMHDSSTDPLAENYCGPSPISEPETKAVANFMLKNTPIQYYFSIHGFGEKLLLPFGDKTLLDRESFSEIENAAKKAIARMGENGTKYDYGTAYDAIGTRISGDSASWVKRTYGSKCVVTFLFRNKGDLLYAIPPEEIVPSCQEIVVGISSMMTDKGMKPTTANTVAAAIVTETEKVETTTTTTTEMTIRTIATTEKPDRKLKKMGNVQSFEKMDEGGNGGQMLKRDIVKMVLMVVVTVLLEI